MVHLEPEWENTDAYGNTIPPAKAVIQTVNRHHLIIQLLGRNETENGFRLLTSDQQTPFEQSDFLVSAATSKKKSFGVIVRRRSTNQILIDTTRGPLVLSAELVEMSTALPSRFIYGLGSQRATSLRRNFDNGKYALYSRAAADGFHPFYMAVEPEGGLVHAVFWDNNHPLEVQLSPFPVASFRAMGGNGIVHLLSGPSPAAVSKQLMQDIIGAIRMPPYWALGLHLCRESDDKHTFQRTFNNMNSSGIGYDSDCIDLRLSGPGSGVIDSGFPDAESQRSQLKDAAKKFVLAQPPHVRLDSDALRSTAADEWIVTSKGNQSVVGKRLDASVGYPSFVAIDDNSTRRMLRINSSGLLDPDGIHFVDNWPANEDQNQDKCTDRWHSFVPQELRNSLTHGTLCADAFHPSIGREHFAIHNQYGIQHVLAFIRQWEKHSGGSRRLLYLNRASALANLGLAGYSGDDFSANWASMKMALVQVNMSVVPIIPNCRS